MSASIWAPGSELVTIDAESTNLSQVFTATADQTVFNLTSFSYSVGTGSIAVYRGGQRIILGLDWTEASSTSITLSGVAVAAGEVIEVVAVLGSASSASIAAAASAASASVSASAASASAASALHPWEAAAGGIKYVGGNVGIGTVVPSGALSIAKHGSGIQDALSIFNNSPNDGDGVAIKLGYGDFGNSYGRRITATGNAGVQYAGAMTFDNANGEGWVTDMVIGRNGDVGIGNQVPVGQLDVYKAGAGRMIINYEGTAVNYIDSNATLFRKASDGTVVVQISGTGLSLHSPSLTMGYGAGAGGTVTQATSKATAVTINRPSGGITTAADALAGGAKVTFLVNNNIVGSSQDVVVCNVYSNGAGAAGRYRASITYTSNGAFYVTLENITGVSYSEVVHLSFAVIKGTHS